MYLQFSKKWNLPEEAIISVYQIIESTGGRYGKAHRVIESFGVNISVRQLRYFYKKVRFYKKYDIERKGRPNNYSQLLRNKT